MLKEATAFSGGSDHAIHLGIAGWPQQTYSDNGLHFASEGLQALFRGYGTQMIFGPISNPHGREASPTHQAATPEMERKPTWPGRRTRSWPAWTGGMRLGLEWQTQSWPKPTSTLIPHRFDALKLERELRNKSGGNKLKFNPKWTGPWKVVGSQSMSCSQENHGRFMSTTSGGMREGHFRGREAVRLDGRIDSRGYRGIAALGRPR